MSRLGKAASSDDDEFEQEWSDWDEAGDDADPTQSLFCSTVLPSVKEALQHDIDHYGFDLGQFRQQARLTDYDTIKCINFIRAETAAGRAPLKQLGTAIQPGKRGWDSDQYMKPTLQNDPLLFYDFDDGDAEEADAEQPSSSETSTSKQHEQAQGAATSTSIQQLRDENMALRDALEQMSALAMPAELASDSRFQSDQQWYHDGAGPSSPAAPNRLCTAQANVTRSPEEASERINEAYFDSYGFFGIHRDMLSDKVRTEAYRDAMSGNPGLLKGATVLDVGCGTAILSMFAAKAGASQVIGVDGSERIAQVAQRLVDANGLSQAQGGPVTILQGRLEQLPGLPVEKVDVIVSEWMGYALLFEAMLGTVLYARDRWLKPGGAILPDLASVHIAAAGEGATGLSFWDKVYGFDYSLVRGELLQDAHKTAMVKAVSPQDLLSSSCCVCQLDLATMTAADTDFSSDFLLEADAQTSDAQQCHALVLWFDTDFSSRFCSEQAGKLSTSPQTEQTHWCQTVLVLREPLLLGFARQDKTVAHALKGRFGMARSNKHRGIDMSVEYAAQYADGSMGETSFQIFSMTMSSDT